MSVLRVRPRRSNGPLECDWALIDGTIEVDRGEGPLRDAPGHAARAELVIPASDWLITCVQLPPSARRRAGATLAYAVEEETLGDPESQHVTWLGNRGGADVLGVVDRAGFRRWLEALEKTYGSSAAYGETLLLPRMDAEWSLAWDGVEGFVRTGELEGAATDSGDRYTPPLALQLMLDHAAARDALPSAIAVHVTAPDAAPDLDSWQEKLGVRLYAADGDGWDWRTASPSDRARITQREDGAGARALSRVVKRLRPAAWIAAAALAVHVLALVADWSWRTYERRALRQQMETRFRAAFPDAVSVVDPVLQMRRKLADLRHAAHQADPADFLPLMGHVGTAAKELPAGTLRLVTYERGRLTLQFGAIDEASVQRIAGRLRDAGLRVDVASPPASSKSGERTLVVTESAQIGSDLAVLRAQAATLERQAAEIERLRALPAPAPRPLELRATVDSAMRAAGVTQGLRVDARGADEAQVVLGSAPFSTWLASVAGLQAQQVRLETGRIEALPGPGLVSATATFVRSARP